MFAAKDALLTRPSGGYTISRSLRFRSSASAYLNRTFGTPTNADKCSFSFWHKRGKLGSTNVDVLATSSTDNEIAFGANATADTIGIYMGAAWRLVSTQLFRDPSAWYHFLVVIDVANATAAQKLRVYVNGVEITTWTTDTRSGLTTGSSVINTAVAHRIASYDGSINFCDGYFAETNFVDGQALTPTSFGATNATTGVWAPIKYAGTYGANGFHLDFNSYATTAALGTDTSGNGNTWTVNNVSVTAGVTYDSMIDVPTVSAAGSNYCVLNPVDKVAAATWSDGNLAFNQPTGAGGAKGTFAVSSGKWYWEVTPTANGQIIAAGPVTVTGALADFTSAQGGYGYYWTNGNKYINGVSSAYGAAYAINDVIGVALDMNALTITFYKNNASQGAITGVPAGTYAPFVTNGAGVATTGTYNFGQRGFTYTPPSGYSALNTYNLPAPTILIGNTVMDATLYTGTGASLSVTNAAGFQPDLVWVKSRSAATDHAWYDSVRGVQKQIESNTTTAETTETTGLTAFGSGGFTVGALAQMNTSAATYVGWQWKESATAGFDILTYTGDGGTGASSQYVNHSLGVSPQMIFTKVRSSAATYPDWYVFHASIQSGNAAYYGLLDSTAAWSTGSSPYQLWTYNASQIAFNTTANENGKTYVAYAFAPIAGYSAFGSYTGNGSTDGPFVFLGFRPRWLMIKRSSTASVSLGWQMYDTSRQPVNTAASDPNLWADGSNAEGIGNYVFDLLSNGFKIRSSGVNENASSDTYIYAAFAESPFKNSLAR